MSLTIKGNKVNLHLKDTSSRNITFKKISVQSHVRLLKENSIFQNVLKYRF